MGDECIATSIPRSDQTGATWEDVGMGLLTNSLAAKPITRRQRLR